MVLASVHEMVYDANNKRFDRKTRIAPEKLLMHWALEEKMKKNKMKMKKKKKRKKRNFLFLCVKESKSTLGIYKEEHIKKTDREIQNFQRRIWPTGISRKQDYLLENWAKPSKKKEEEKPGRFPLNVQRY